MFANDNFPLPEGAMRSLDQHGLAALLLVESLIHGLCERDALGVRQAVEIAERAVEVQYDRAEATDGDAAVMWHAHALLVSISTSLRADDQDEPENRPDDRSTPPRLVS